MHLSLKVLRLLAHLGQLGLEGVDLVALLVEIGLLLLGGLDGRFQALRDVRDLLLILDQVGRLSQQVQSTQVSKPLLASSG